MLERRHRILLEAQTLLDEAGVEGFTIRELSKRAKVAQRTLYNVFGSKEEIVASTIEERHKSLMANARRAPMPAEHALLDLRQLDATAEVVYDLRSYATALAAAFFSPTANDKIYQSLLRVSVESSGNWLERAQKAKIIRHLSPDEKERLLSLTVNAGYATTLDWAAGRIGKDELKRRYKINFLLCVHYALRPSHRKDVEKVLDQLLNEKPDIPGT